MTDGNEYVGDDGYTYVTRRVEWRVQSVEVDQYGQNPKAYAEAAFPTRAAAEEYRAKIAKLHEFVSRWVPNDATHSYVECLITRVEVVVPDALLNAIAAIRKGQQ